MDLISDQLIDSLKRNTPDKENTVDLLMSIISVGKEAAYRRLRGEIPFTLDEAVAICRRMNISLDLLIGIKHEDIYAFHLNAIYSKDPITEYHKMLTEIIEAVNYTNKDPDCISYRAYRSLPQEFVFKYNLLSKLYLYILLYQLYPQYTPKTFSDIDIPEKVLSVQKKATLLMHEVSSILILDKHIVADYVELVKYFQNLDMISNEEVALMKEQLYMMLDDMEKCALTGISLSGKDLDIYISHISFDCTYTYIEGSNFEASSIGVYCIDHISCDNPTICQTQKSWIKSLMRFSTLISVSGELQRNEYFYKQRKIIDTL